MELPIEFETEMRELLGAEYDLFISSLDRPRHFGLRVNNLKISTEDFLKICPFTLKKVPWTDNGFYYIDEEKPTHHPYYFAGLYYIQEPSAMTPAALLPVNKGDAVLDMCAAPGGKSTELAAKLGGTGLLVSNDISASRAKALLKNIELFGVSNSCVMSEDTNNILKYSDIQFDKILLDAPCSGEGMFRKDAKLLDAWKKQGPDFYSKIQKQLILIAADLLKPGGEIIYSTFTFNRLENEGTVEYLLENRDDFEIVDLGEHEGFKYGTGKMAKTARLIPYMIEGEGHFVALLRKKAANNITEDVDSDFNNFNQESADFVNTEKADSSSKKSRKSKKKSNNNQNKAASSKLPEELEEFISSLNGTELGGTADGEGTFTLNRDRIVIRNDKVFLLPETDFTDGKKYRVLRNGLYMGDMKKNRFEPSTTFALALSKKDYNNVIDLSSSDPRVDKYLKGETLAMESDEIEEMNLSDGNVLIAVDGFPLGWGRLLKSTIKNKYLPAWRKLN